MDEEEELDVCYQDMYELRGEAIAYFVAEKRKDRELCTAIADLKASLYGWPTGKWSDEGIDLVREWLRTTTYDYWEWTAIDAKGDFVEGPTEHVYASEYKAAIVGRELAPYV